MNTKKNKENPIKNTKLNEEEMIPMNKKEVKEILTMKKIIIENPNPQKNAIPYKGREKGGFPQRVFKDLPYATYEYTDEVKEVCFKIGNHLAYKTQEVEIYVMYFTELVEVNKIEKTITVKNYNTFDDMFFTSYSTQRAIGNYVKYLKEIYGDYTIVDEMEMLEYRNGKIVNLIKENEQKARQEEEAKAKAEAKAKRDEERAREKAKKELKAREEKVAREKAREKAKEEKAKAKLEKMIKGEE